MFIQPSLLALLACHAFGAIAAKAGAKADAPAAAAVPAADAAAEGITAAMVNAQVKTTFPDADILGVKLVNGRPTTAIVEVTNKEASPIFVSFVTGALSKVEELPAGTPAYQGIVRNLTASQYNLEVTAGETKTVPFSFSLDMHPQDVRLRLVAVLSNEKGHVFQYNAFDGETSIVEAPTSFLDPQM